MQPEDLARVRAAHAEALGLPVNRRAEFLRITFHDAPELQEEVRSLLDSYEQSGEFLAAPLAERIIGLPPDLKSVRIGPYELIEPLGKGGSAAVYRARRADTLYDRNVAIKVFSRLALAPEAFRRFQREIQILARVDHQYIVRLIEAGTTGEALAYIVTELVEGQHLDKFAASLPLRGRLTLFSKICEGVSAAHRSLVVHRDLKPSNILVTAEGDPKLVDFGIALLLNDNLKLTETGLERMTVYYASPEQLRGDKAITTASDVYSLGVLLYELVSDSVPYDFPKHELAARIQQEEPAHLKNVPRELGAIVHKAMEKQPDRRYSSVEGLRDDVIRYLDGSPVAAHGNGAFYRISSLARKHWLSVAMTCLTGILLLVLSFISIASSLEARRQSARVKELVSRSLNDATEDPEHHTELRVIRRVREIKLNFLNSLVREYPSDFEIERLRFLALRELGLVEAYPSGLNLGETLEGRKSLETAVLVGENIIARWPRAPSIQAEVTSAYIELGAVLLEMDRQSEAKSSFDRAERLSASLPAATGIRPHLEALAQQSRIMNLLGRKEEALKLRRQIVEGRKELFRKDPVSLRWEYPGGLCSYGELLREMGRFAEAEQAYSIALPMVEADAEAVPHTLGDTWHFARESEEYAKVLFAVGLDSSALKHLQRAIDLYNSILREDLNALSDQRALAVCLKIMGSYLAQHGQIAKGRQLISEALILSRRAVRLDPGSFRAKQEMKDIEETHQRLHSLMQNSAVFRSPNAVQPSPK